MLKITWRKWVLHAGENEQGIEMPGNWSWRRPRSCLDRRTSADVPVFTGQAYHPIITVVSQWESLLWQLLVLSDFTVRLLNYLTFTLSDYLNFWHMFYVLSLIFSYRLHHHSRPTSFYSGIQFSIFLPYFSCSDVCDHFYCRGTRT